MARPLAQQKLQYGGSSRMRRVSSGLKARSMLSASINQSFSGQSGNSLATRRASPSNPLNAACS